jgi:hypothetical protein
VYDPNMGGWSVADIADALAEGIGRAEAERRAEQAVYGLDALDELRLHTVLDGALRKAGYGVQREVRYPSERGDERASVGERCDFVLTPEGRPLRECAGRATLFDRADSVELDEAFWLEIKVAWQHTTEGPNPRYAAQMLSVARHDVSKLSRDPGILHAGLAMLCFVESEPIARHDLLIWYQRYVDRGLPVWFPSIRTIPIVDRIGNARCAIAVCGIAHL